MLGTKRARSTRRKRVALTANSSAENSSSSTDILQTPTNRVAIEEVQASFREMTVRCNDREDPARCTAQSIPSSSPRTRKKGELVRKKLFACKRENVPWSTSEDRGLVTFLLLHTDGNSWPSRKHDISFWKSAGEFVQSYVNSEHCRTGGACRSRVTKKLSQKFKNPSIADKHFDKQSSDTTPEEASVPVTQSPSSEIEVLTVAPPHQRTTGPPHEPTTGHPATPALGQCLMTLESLTFREKLEILSQTFSTITNERVPIDFFVLIYEGMKHLRDAGRANVIYLLAKSVGTMRQDGNDTLLPTRRMPMGLLEYMVSFFTASSVHQVSCPPDYRSWLQTLYVLFGSKWLRIYSGPMWSVEPIMQADGDDYKRVGVPAQALVNVPAVSDRTLRRDIEKSFVSVGSDLQVSMLKHAHECEPNTLWWIKGDGVDIVKGLKVSTRGQWSGDSDVGDGALLSLRHEYDQRMSTASNIGLDERSTEAFIEVDLNSSLRDVKDDLTFIHKELSKANARYEAKHLAGNSSEKVMLSLLWDVEELNRLNKEARALTTAISVALDVLAMPGPARMEHNLPRKLQNIRTKLSQVVQGIYRFKRTPATHSFVMMISSALRERKPYAIPIQCFPYAGLKESDMRHLVTNIVKEMTKEGMQVAGFVSNGEFNFLRSKGYTRPLSVLQIRTNARNACSKYRQSELLGMLTPIVLADGTVTAMHPNPAIPVQCLKRIVEWEAQGATRTDIVDRLRSMTVPPGYSPHPWSYGKSEDLKDKLRSIVAQFEFQYQILQWEDQGVEFRTYLYVPERHPASGAVFCEREDEPHVLKRIAQHTRAGGPEALNLLCYKEAYDDASTGLTLAALTGTRKQSVTDAERLFSPGVVEFMKKKGYTYEEKYTEAICNWRRACDERGLSELKRCRFNYELLNLVLDELMPWHYDMYDFSLLEVNRPINNVLGFSRETLVAVITNIEGREWCRRLARLQKPEHPRSSTSDDVECFFSMMRDALGSNFTSKEVQYGFRKVALEFVKRLDPELPFYYHTSTHTRYSEGPLKAFHVPSQKKKRKASRAPRRELSSATFSSRRAQLPVQGSLSVRTIFHNQPVNLPPPPNEPIAISEHFYTLH